jgi:hypothetical protein
MRAPRLAKMATVANLGPGKAETVSVSGQKTQPLPYWRPVNFSLFKRRYFGEDDTI